MDNVLQFPRKIDPTTTDLHATIETVTECLNMFKQAYPSFPNNELFGSLVFLIVKNESRLENGVTVDQLLAACRRHLAKGH